jgi:hypothetical protein
LDPKIRVVARRRAWSGAAPALVSSASSRRAAAASGFAASSSVSSPATIATASSTRATRCGKASRKNPLIRTVTSTRGRPSSSTVISSSPVIRRVSVCQTGRTPSRARISAMSSPWVRIAAVPHTTIPIDLGGPPSSRS